ncbi:peptidoglycan DD-metalloendopeptidase family protein [Spirulina sp. CS-785/01]|uniref:murein hydrolase activator EnvC family protein n=1 Tax=Spirulina sp. CS-785/01 TaxID=3021716 RepID=UPI00233048CF|nr:M23 family metallopeptidase [Spirulina sp. CS-785/01]MDB9313182.1 peptidoglycan DD-metalloendopeptidase family protein [Spirulina sp. CS-785/01]
MSSVALAAPTPPSVNLLQHWQQELQQQQQEVQQESDRLANIEEAAQRYRSRLKHNVRLMDLQLDYYEEQLQVANRDLGKLEQDLGKERKSYAPKLKATIARLRFLQRQSVASHGWGWLLGSKDINEFFDRRARLKRVYQADRKHLQELQRTANKIKARKADIQQQKENIAQLRSQILQQQQDIKTQLAIQEDLLNRLKTDQTTLVAVQQQLEADSEGLMELIQDRVSRSPSFIVGGTGQFMRPHNAQITSKFGWRKHPILGGKRLHAGIDFGGSYGSPIFAADSGTVIFAGWYGGYGKTVVIDHGGGVTTLYGHTRKINVKEGQPIKQGANIAEVGSTGLSTGPHLHFELRKGGKPVDPLQYLGNG